MSCALLQHALTRSVLLVAENTSRLELLLFDFKTSLSQYAEVATLPCEGSLLPRCAAACRDGWHRIAKLKLHTNTYHGIQK